MPSVSLEQFLELPDNKIAELIRSFGQQVCVFPFNGTRRWFLLEHGNGAGPDPQSYIEETTKGYIHTFKLLFDHGIETVIAPVFGSEILKRGEEYMSQIGASMGLLAEHPEFISFYKEYDIRIHFYGDYRKEFKPARYESITKSFDAVAEQTSSNKKRRLFYGVFANDATQTISELSIQYYKANNRIPTRHELIEAYYGEYIEKADLFIGFEKFTVFDYPMLNWGEESLYFTIAPSLYMTQTLLRKILYDHIFLRPLPEPDYSKMSGHTFESMRKFYADKRDTALGVGHILDDIWYAKPN